MPHRRVFLAELLNHHSVACHHLSQQSVDRSPSIFKRQYVSPFGGTSLRRIFTEASFVVYAARDWLGRCCLLMICNPFARWAFSSSRFMHAGQTLYAATMPPLNQCGYVLMKSTQTRRMHGPEPMLRCLMSDHTNETFFTGRLDRHH